MKFRLFAAVLAGFVSVAVPGVAHAGERDFAAVFSARANGAIVQAGNTLMTCPDAASGCEAARQGADDNNSFAMGFVDLDGDSSTPNSSSADLVLPSGATVLYAGLMWGADRGTLAGGTPAASAGQDEMRFKVPGGAYRTVTASTFDYWYGRAPYGAYADVTDLVTGGGTYWGADVKASTGEDGFAAWALVVAYADPSQPMRDLSVHRGFQVLRAAEPSETITVDGLLTPKSGPVRARVGVVAYEGDVHTLGDQLDLNGTPLTDAASPAGNTLNSAETVDGVNVTGRDPSWPNLMGADIKTFDTTDLIANDATSARIGLSTTDDVFVAQLVTAQIDLYAPFFAPVKTVEDVNGAPARTGDVLRFTVTYPNTGQDAAVNAMATDALPEFTAYVPGSLLLGASPQTDGPGDDAGEFTGTGVRFDLGTVPPSGTATVSYEARVTDAAAGREVVNRASIAYEGDTLGAKAVQDSNETRTPVDGDVHDPTPGTPEPPGPSGSAPGGTPPGQTPPTVPTGDAVPPLARTGSDVAVAGAGAALVLLGGALVALVRRRRD